MFRSIARGALLLAASFALGTHGAAAADDPRPDPVPDTRAATANAVEPTLPMSVYDVMLGPGWENWSWAKTDLSIELGGSPRRPIRVAAQAWQALYLHHAAFLTTGLSKLSFLIQGSVPDREVRAFMLTNGKIVGEGKVVKISNTGWTNVVIPLATLGVEDTLVDGIWIQNASETELPKFYVTDIRLD
jgi:hypothetical protein